jgi:hypothetical protein
MMMLEKMYVSDITDKYINRDRSGHNIVTECYKNDCQNQFWIAVNKAEETAINLVSNEMKLKLS